MRIPKNPVAWPVLAAGAAIASLSVLAGRLHPRRPGSLTSANDAVDDIELRPDATPDEVVDVGVKHTFPASDPPAVATAVETAFEKKAAGDPHPPGAVDMSPPSRSPDWMLRR